jgi:Ni/Co efflux regulator RcnB
MRTAFVTSLLLAMSVATVHTQALADEHDNHHYVHHEEWRKGEKIRDEDWRRGEHVDYKEYHLGAPPRGYEWRLVDGNYVLAAVATGVIASVIVASEAGR